MMFLFLTLAFLITPHHSSSVTSSFNTRASPDDSDVCDNINNCRRLFDIIWGCLGTIFACVWISVHPNVPPPKPPHPATGASLWVRVKWRLIDSHGALISRLKLMFVGLLALELMAGFAGRQLAMARYFSKEYKISLTHGFFLCMGGFVDEEGHPIVTTDQIEQPGVLAGITKTPEAFIEDKSKADAFSKAVAFIQGLWFVAQCIARTAQHLPLTKLEVVTLAYAVVNIFTWLLWWGKPMDIRDPVVVEAAVPENTRPPQQKQTWWLKFTNLLGLGPCDNDVYNPLANNAVPTFWFVSEEDRYSSLGETAWMSAFFGEFIVAAIFGAIHCVAWHTAFPSIAEMWLWRISAAIISGLPLILLCISPFSDQDTLNVPMVAGIVLYTVNRLVLLVVALTVLRALPSATFVDVNWSVYIPHL
ncbi:hypothetical protein C8F01DRAFT_1254896 [Mycena amicta]|nr:hypothetical protein C8F01DRAFT_1254896 [Mycena amicta]